MVRILPIVGLLLLIPLIAMQLTDEVNWSFFDFVIMGVMLSITGLAIGIIIKKIKYYKYRNIFITIIVMIFLLTWAELGVGLFGTPFAGDWLSTNHPTNKKPHECGAWLYYPYKFTKEATISIDVTRIKMVKNVFLAI